MTDGGDGEAIDFVSRLGPQKPLAVRRLPINEDQRPLVQHSRYEEPYVGKRRGIKLGRYDQQIDFPKRIGQSHQAVGRSARHKLHPNAGLSKKPMHRFQARARAGGRCSVFKRVHSHIVDIGPSDGVAGDLDHSQGATSVGDLQFDDLSYAKTANRPVDWAFDGGFGKIAKI